MKHNKILVILMAIALLIGTFISAAAAGRYAIPRDGDEDQGTPPTLSAPETPHVGVTGLLVGTEYFELSLKVSAREFQTVGVVLSYDAKVLTPIVWSSGEKNEDGTPKAISMDPASNNNWNRPVVLPSRGADGLAGKPALSYLGYDQEQQQQTGRGYLYLGADTLQYGDLIGERVVTVRFRREVETEITMPENPSTDDVMDENFTVCLASEPISLEAIPGHPLLLTAQGENRLPQSYTNYRHIRAADIAAAAEGEAETGSTEEPAPTPEFDCTLSFSFGDVESADSTGGSGDYAITFFDWDGRVIDAIAAPENAEEAVAKWRTNPTIDARLTNKAGYTFDKWLVVYENNDGEGLHTESGSLTSRKSTGEDDKLNSADIADFGNLEQMAKEDSKSVLVQAAYVANETVNDSLGEDANLNLPTTQYELDDNPTYYQYGPATADVATYGITFTIKRNSMLRTDQPTIQARIYANPTGTKSDIVTVRLDLENTDETTFEVFVPKSATQVDVVLRDTYGKTDWTNAQPRSARITIEKATFVYEGAIATIIDEAWQVANGTGSWNAVDRQCFLDAKCGTVADEDNAKNRLVAATNANGGKKLTAEQVQNAVKGS